MKIIQNIHPELLQILEQFSEYFFEQRTDEQNNKLESFIGKNPKMKDVCIRDMVEKATSEDYLRDALKQPLMKYGYPRHSWGLELSQDSPWIDDNDLKQQISQTNNKLINYFGARNNALQMYYPANGYIGWHTNCNAAGYNIILSCNPGGQGYFAHYDHREDKFNYYPDNKGWNCKAGYFGSDMEPDKVYWHSARTVTPRLTLSYIIYDKNIWENMVEEIDYKR